MQTSQQCSLHKAYVIHWVQLDHYSSHEKAYTEGLEHLEMLLSRVYDIDSPKLSAASVDMRSPMFGHSLGDSNMTREEYARAVVRAKEHILAGDIFQIVLRQRFEKRTFADPFEIYRALRVTSPSSYMPYIQAKGCIHVASRPEIFTRVTKGKIVNKPLAGTLRRGNTQQEDSLREIELLGNQKQCAEHIMLVDLARNDVGKVSKVGSVNVEGTMKVERFPHVMHISSTVTGELLDHLTCWDALRAALPVGTISGAPKVNTYIALALRAMVFRTGPHYDTMYSYKGSYQCQEWIAHLQPGAGIVADSNPDDEYDECVNKASSMAKAIKLAEFAFVDRENEEAAKSSSVLSHVVASRESIFKN